MIVITMMTIQTTKAGRMLMIRCIRFGSDRNSSIRVYGQYDRKQRIQENIGLPDPESDCRIAAHVIFGQATGKLGMIAITMMMIRTTKVGRTLMIRCIKMTLNLPLLYSICYFLPQHRYFSLTLSPNYCCCPFINLNGVHHVANNIKVQRIRISKPRPVMKDNEKGTGNAQTPNIISADAKQ
jgi:hypothetical protein